VLEYRPIYKPNAPIYPTSSFLSRDDVTRIISVVTGLSNKHRGSHEHSASQCINKIKGDLLTCATDKLSWQLIRSDYFK